MKSIKFPFVNCIMKNQETDEPELFIHDTEDGKAITMFKLTPEEIEEIQKTGMISLTVVTYGNRMPPIFPNIDNPYGNPMIKCDKCEALELEEKITQDIDNDENLCRDCVGVDEEDETMKIVN